MYSKQNLPATRFSKSKTCFSYFIAGHYLMCSSLAYAGPGTFGTHVESDLDSKIITRPLNTPLNKPQEDSPSVSSSLSPFSSTLEWMHESALSGCDRFGRWVASYAKEIPPAYFAQSLLEVDYANDPVFWKGHFNQELEDIKKSPYLDLQERAKLKGLQELVWNGVLSPYAYEKGLRELGKKSLFSKVKSIREAFQSELKETPEFVLQHLRKDLTKTLDGIQNNREGSEQTLLAKLDKKLTYYRNAMNAFDYGESLAGVCLRMEENKEKLALSTTQYKGFMSSLTNELRKINQKQYFQIKAERESYQSIQDGADTLQDQELASTKAANPDVSSKSLEEDNTSASLFSYPLSLAKSASALLQKGVSFAIENPLQAITMGAAVQAAAVAAAASFSSPQHSRGAKGRLRHGINATRNGFLDSKDRGAVDLHNQKFIDLGRLSSAQGFMIEGAVAGDGASTVGSAGDFNGDGLNDTIIGAPSASPQGRKSAGCSYIVYGQKGSYLAPLDLASLNATQGVIIQGAAASDWSGYSVSSAGDFNGDGINDVIIGAPEANNMTGSSYVVYGKKGGYPNPIDLASLNANHGVTIQGARQFDNSGYSVGLAGDFNGDNVSDVIIGAPDANPEDRSGAGSSYIIYGKKGGHHAPIDLARLNATQSVIIQGARERDGSGWSVSSAGDFNDDGLSDVIIGAPDAAHAKNRAYAGSSYVIYGKKGGYPNPIDLASLNATHGVTIQGARQLDISGYSVGLAGDFNGDNVSDVMVGAPYADPLGRNEAGSSYVIYGQKGGYHAPIDLARLNATQSVIIEGAKADDHSGWSVSSAGDFNGDGLSDAIIGVFTADPKGRHRAGASYVIYGQKSGYHAPIDLKSLGSSQGVIIDGAKAYDGSGRSVSSAGDFNGDNVSDVIVGAPWANPLGRDGAGSSYVIYGKKGGYPAPIDPIPYIIGVSSGLAVVGILSSIGLAATYRDRIGNWICSRGYTSIDEEIK